MEQSKFAGALANLKKPPATASPPPVDVFPGDPPPTRGRGRPRAKSSNPDYQPTTVILRKRTKRAAARLLEDQETGKDLSDLIEELLTEWIQRQS
jgi:hypothetical protein